MAQERIGSMGSLSIPALHGLLGNKWKALCNQSSTDAPTAIEFINDTGGTLTFTYTNTGQYLLTSSLPIFLENKTTVSFGANNYTGSGATRAFFGWQRLNNTDIEIKSFDGDGFELDGLITDLLITIEIYP